MIIEFLEIRINYNKKYGISAGIGYDDTTYGLDVGYNSNDNNMYLNIGELEGFANHDNSKIKVGEGHNAIVFFQADWCGYCQRFKPEWAKFKKEMNGKKVNSKVLMVLECTDQEEEKIKNYNVEGYPTLCALDSNGEIIEVYEGQRKVEDLKEFCYRVFD